MKATVKRHLLDVNVVLAVIDPAHEHHTIANPWFLATGRNAFATCPIVENGVLRIASSAAYPNRPGDVDTVRLVLERLCQEAGHVFWADSISLVDVLPRSSGLSSKEVTDAYLVRLATANKGVFVTFDKRVAGDAATLLVLAG